MNVAFFLKPKSEVAYLYNDYSIRQGLEKMCNHGYTAIPVLDRNGGYVGTISEGDFLWHIVDGENTQVEKTDIKDQENVKISEIMKKNKNESVNVTADMSELFEKAKTQNFVPVIDDRGYFIGIVTRQDIIKYFYEKCEF